MSGRTPLEVGLFEILKGIIDDEWGPYDDDHYWELVDKELPRLGLTREHSQATRNCSYPGGGGPCEGRHHQRWVSAWAPADPT